MRDWLVDYEVDYRAKGWVGLLNRGVVRGEKSIESEVDLSEGEMSEAVKRSVESNHPDLRLGDVRVKGVKELNRHRGAANG